MTNSRIDPNFPDRPQDPDFWKLSEIINTLDKSAEEIGWEATIQKFLPTDPVSMTYMGRQRAKIMLQVLSDVSPEDQLSVQWTDGFAVGVRYGMEVAQVVSEVVLDESVDGNRRQRSKAAFCYRCWEVAKNSADQAGLRSEGALQAVYDGLRAHCPHQGK